MFGVWGVSARRSKGPIGGGPQRRSYAVNTRRAERCLDIGSCCTSAVYADSEYLRFTIHTSGYGARFTVFCRAVTPRQA